MDELLTVIEKVGFPIVISLFLLLRVEQKLKNLTTSINELIALLRNETREKH